jgi:hypothetical protein
VSIYYLIMHFDLGSPCFMTTDKKSYVQALLAYLEATFKDDFHKTN